MTELELWELVEEYRNMADFVCKRCGRDFTLKDLTTGNNPEEYYSNTDFCPICNGILIELPDGSAYDDGDQT